MTKPLNQSPQFVSSRVRRGRAGKREFAECGPPADRVTPYPRRHGSRTRRVLATAQSSMMLPYLIRHRRRTTLRPPRGCTRTLYGTWRVANDQPEPPRVSPQQRPFRVSPEMLDQPLLLEPAKRLQPVRAHPAGGSRPAFPTLNRNPIVKLKERHTITAKAFETDGAADIIVDIVGGARAECGPWSRHGP